MKQFKRNNLLFSLCGLNCGLCVMHLDGYCPGCGGGPGNQSCAIARCSQEHGGIEYCYQCPQFPCKRYDGIDAFDSFIPHRNRRTDIQKARDLGPDSYNAEQIEKIKALTYLLETCNDGRRKIFFCTAVNLLRLSEIASVIGQLKEKAASTPLSLKEKAAFAAELLQKAADRDGIVLKLHRKPRKK